MTSYPNTPLSAGFVAGSHIRSETTRPAEPEVRSLLARDGDRAAAALAAECRSLRESVREEPRRPRIGWKLGLVIDLALLSLPIPAVIVIPPVLECRHTSLHVGFFAGDSFEACAHRRVVARWGRFDARIKMIVRGSGR